MSGKAKKIKLSRISALHYYKLVFRSLLFVWALVMYILARGEGRVFDINNPGVYEPVMWVVWAVFAVEMVLRFFPSRWESMGCQKQFAGNYQPRPRDYSPKEPDVRPGGRWMVLLSWVALNGAIGTLRLFGLIDDGVLVLICLAYSVCDVICILFFCPFQTLFFKNRCCVTCRIYNWDFAMMFTPLFFVPGLYTWSLLAIAIVLLAFWEITFFFHPERFSENTNAFLTCQGCNEQLCRHKKQLISLWKKNEQFFTKRIKFLKLH